MQLDPLNLMKSLGCQIGLPAMGATLYGDIFNNQQVRSRPVATGHFSGFNATLSAKFAYHKGLPSLFPIDGDKNQFSGEPKFGHDNSLPSGKNITLYEIF